MGHTESSAARPLPYECRLSSPRGATVGESGSMESGPGIRISLRIDDELRVAEAAFEARGFEDARIAASRLCGAVVGCTIDQVSAVSLIDVGLMAGLAPRHPAVRAVHFAKSAALLPWLGRRAVAGAHITCTCFHVSTESIRAAIRDRRLRTVDDVREATKAGSGCGCCRPDVMTLLDEPR